jgi:hypothetical protein
VIRQNYLSIDNFDDLVKIFPMLETYRNCKGYEIKFLLAMVCLTECVDQAGWNFGLNLLMALVRDPEKSKLLKDFYNFDYKSLIRLTSKYDVYGFNKVTIAERNAAISEAERNAAISERDRLATELDLIRNSASWKLTSPLRWLKKYIFNIK